MRIFETEDSNRQYITYGIFKHYEKKPSGNSEIGLPLIVRKNCPKKRMKDFKAQGKSDCWKSFRQKVKRESLPYILEEDLFDLHSPPS